MTKSKVLFLCVGNSGRSQLAEAIALERYSDRWEAFSAGSHPASEVHPLALKVLREIGIEHKGRTKSIEEFRGQAFDLVVLLCDSSDNECPVWLGKGRVINRPFPNPANVRGSEAEKLAAFRDVRDGIASELNKILAG